MDNETKEYLRAMEERIAALIAGETATTHSELKGVEERLTWRIDEIDRRLKRVDSNTNTTMELLARQSRWHEQSDNSLSGLSTEVNKLRERIEKLERERPAQ
jgi:predicted  nucleic acid-binding Zn-ribbon protein